MASRLVVRGVEAGYGSVRVLHGVSIEVRAGEVVGLLGRNGVGKTTTLKAIMGMARRTGGRITFEGRDLQGVPPHGLAGLGFGTGFDHEKLTYFHQGANQRLTGVRGKVIEKALA